MNKFVRIEKDSIGEKEIDYNCYYGVQSLRAKENFNITGRLMERNLIKNLANIKNAAIKTNFDEGSIDENVYFCVKQACEEVANGQFDNQFIVDEIQGGAGTSANMNVNEVICNRALELLGKEKGEFQFIHPNDTINKCQSTNDVFPTAGKLTMLDLSKNLIEQLEKLVEVLLTKANDFMGIIKLARTQLQDAVPMKFGRTFESYAFAFKRDIDRINSAKEYLKIINLGGTAIGSGIDATKYYIKNITKNLSNLTGYDLVQSESLFDGTSNLDCFLNFSSALKTCAMNLSKMCNDLRLLASGPKTGLGEIILPPKQNGSSIMPGKFNPVIPEVVNQVAFMVIGNDVTVALATEEGQLELNAFEPVIFARIFESEKCLTNAINTLIENCLKSLKINEARVKYLLENSVGIVTALCPYLGYQKSAEIAKEAIKSNLSIKEILIRDNLFSEDKINDILDLSKIVEIYSKD